MKRPDLNPQAKKTRGARLIRTKSSTRIVMTIIMKTVPLMMTTPFDLGILSPHFIPWVMGTQKAVGWTGIGYDPTA